MRTATANFTYILQLELSDFLSLKIKPYRLKSNKLNLGVAKSSNNKITL